MFVMSCHGFRQATKRIECPQPSGMAMAPRFVISQIERFCAMASKLNVVAVNLVEGKGFESVKEEQFPADITDSPIIHVDDGPAAQTFPKETSWQQKLQEVLPSMSIHVQTFDRRLNR